MNNAISLPGYPSTVSVMGWIQSHGCPELKGKWFAFSEIDDQYIIVSSISEEDLKYVLSVYPKDTWHDVLGMKRLQMNRRSWYFCINDNFYYADL